MHYIVFVSRLKGLSACVTESREGAVRWFAVSDLAGLKETMIPSDHLMLKRFGILAEPISIQRHKGTKSETGQLVTRPLDLATTPHYARCEIAKRKGKYRVVRFY